MRYEPHAYQIHCINRIIETPKVGLFLDMGLGKSVITLTAIKELRYERFAVGKALIIAPKKVAESTWTTEKDKWDHTRILRVSQVLGSEKQRIEALKAHADIYVINRENVTWLVNLYKNAWPFDMVVVDESSSFKSHTAKRFKSLAAEFNHIQRMVLLTGTPSPNGMMDLWSQIYLLDKGERLENRFTKFRERYFDPATRGRDGTVFTYAIKQGSETAILEKISDICVSMKKEDYIDLPDLIEDEIPVVLDEKARKAYLELEKRMILELPEDESEISVTSAAALSNKLLQLSNGAVYDEDHTWHNVHDCKIDALLELLEGLRERGKQALVFYNFQHDKERIREAVECKTLENDADIASWNEHKCPVLLAHPASAAYGLNLQAGGNHIIWFGLTWNYEQYVQANARLHRQGQTDKVIVHLLSCKNTRDEAVLEALKHKDNAQQYVMDSLKARIRMIKEGMKR